jgi:hypothetical protein
MSDKPSQIIGLQARCLSTWVLLSKSAQQRWHLSLARISRQKRLSGINNMNTTSMKMIPLIVLICLHCSASHLNASSVNQSIQQLTSQHDILHLMTDPRNLRLDRRLKPVTNTIQESKIWQTHIQRRILLPIRILAALLRVLLLPLRILLLPLVVLLRLLERLIRVLVFFLNPLFYLQVGSFVLNVARTIVMAVLRVLRLIFRHERKDEHEEIDVVTVLQGVGGQLEWVKDSKHDNHFKSKAHTLRDHTLGRRYGDAHRYAFEALPLHTRSLYLLENCAKYPVAHPALGG